MKIRFWTIGKDHEGYVSAGIADFTGRISNYFPVSWNIIPPVKNSGLMKAAELKKKEAAVVIKMLGQDDYLVVLDEKGRSMTSPEFAEFIQSRVNAGIRQLIFLIGGAYGSDESILQRADHIWSLSALTFPHQLARLILSEQTYRACTIMRNEKYHHT